MKALSLRPSDAQAGGFLDDVDVTLKTLRFTGWDYNGKAPMTIALKVSMEDADGLTHEQYYSAGDPNKLSASPDGKAIVAMDDSIASGLNMQTNALAFITSIVNAGFPEDKLGDDISVLDGLGVHINQIAQPKRVGMKNPSRDDKTYLLVTRINRLPWETAPKPAAKGAPRAAGGPRAVTPVNAAPPAPAVAAIPVAAPVAASPAASPAAPVAEPPSPETVTKTRNAAIAILAQHGALSKPQLTLKIFQTLTNDPDRNAIVTLVNKDDFLQQATAEGVLSFDGITVTLG